MAQAAVAPSLDTLAGMDAHADTLTKLDAYIRNCDAVIHLVGAEAGAAPNEFVTKRFVAQLEGGEKRLPPLLAAITAGAVVAYTQWEAWLALYHGKPLLVAQPHPKPTKGLADEGRGRIDVCKPRISGDCAKSASIPKSNSQMRINSSPAP